MMKVLLDIDPLECGVTFGTFYPQRVSDILNQIDIDYQRYIFLKGAM